MFTWLFSCWIDGFDGKQAVELKRGHGARLWRVRLVAVIAEDSLRRLRKLAGTANHTLV
jgi:hypothetical protein